MKQAIRIILRKTIEGTFFIYYLLIHRMRVEGKNNIPKEGTLIFCANHKSFLDPPMIKITAGRETYFLAKKALAKNPFMRALGWIFEVMWVTPEAKDTTAIKESLRHLKNGDCIALFPEGTRNGIEKGEKVKDGAAFFALRSGAKVIPIGISGKMKFLSKLTIRYGEPLDFSSYDKNDVEEVTKIIMDKIFELAK